MLSIIICSISPEKLRAVSDNIRATAGCDYELLAYDNRTANRPLAQVYNRGIADAAMPYLLFLHEDVEFMTAGWGAVLERKLQEDDCGVIGFAGCRAMCDTYCGWDNGPAHNVYRYFDNGKLAEHNAEGDFIPVVALDGFALAVRRDVALANAFDEAMLTGFHCYDVDFCIGVAARHTNYVCTLIDIAHYSSGTYSPAWFDTTCRLYDGKWKGLLPLSAGGVMPSAADTELTAYSFLYRTLRIKDLPLGRKARLYRQFCTRFGATPLHLRHCLQHGVKLLSLALS